MEKFESASRSCHYRACPDNLDPRVTPEDDKCSDINTSILEHTSNVILGFIPRIHAKHSSVDPRVEPEDDKCSDINTSILDHTSNVILGFIPRIHADHYPLLDTRDKPEYDNRRRMCFKPENDHKRSFIKGLDVVRQCAVLLERRVQSSTRVRKTQAVTRQTNECIETAESGVDKVVSSCEKNPNVHKTYMNFLRQRKTALDAPLHAVSSGRSMIEMLGVLAIIGVLSVGGIQGFSKAMETYQSHKQLEQINSLIYHILELRDTFKQDYRNQSTTRINGLMGAISALGYLPDDMKLISNETVQDRFGNKFILSYGVDTCRQPDGSLFPCNSTSFYLGISLKTINNAFAISSENQCKNIIKAVTAFDAENGNISRLELKNNYTTNVIIWGKIYCTDSRQTCFKNMTPIKMTQFCKSCTTENCDLILYFIS